MRRRTAVRCATRVAAGTTCRMACSLDEHRRRPLRRRRRPGRRAAHRRSTATTTGACRRARSGAAGCRCARARSATSTATTAPAGPRTRSSSPGSHERPAFLETDTWRALRILSEFVEGFEALGGGGPRGRGVRLGAHGRGQRGVRARAARRRGARRCRVRGHHGRRAGRDGGGQPRRPRGGRPVDRLQHRAAARAAPQPVRRPVGRVPLLLRPQDDVREVLRRVRDHARRVRDARRAVRGDHAHPDRQDPRLPGRARSGMRTGTACSRGSGTSRCPPARSIRRTSSSSA